MKNLKKKLNYLLDANLITAKKYYKILEIEEKYKDILNQRAVAFEAINALIEYSKIYDLKYK